jgi:hypothetical protein
MYVQRKGDDFISVDRAKACSSRRDSVRGRIGPKYKDKTYRCRDLKRLKCSALFTDIGGRWECMPEGVKVF